MDTAKAKIAAEAPHGNGQTRRPSLKVTKASGRACGELAQGCCPRRGLARIKMREEPPLDATTAADLFGFMGTSLPPGLGSGRGAAAAARRERQGHGRPAGTGRHRQARCGRSASAAASGEQ